MPIETKYLGDLKVLETVYSGELPQEELFKGVDNTLNMAIENKTWLLLGDCSQISTNSSLVDMYQLAEYYLTLHQSHKFKEAIIMPEDKEIASNFKFYETTCINRGFNVRVFSDRESAIAWLIH